MNTTTRLSVAVAVLLALFAVAQVGWAAGSLEGHARLEKVKDNPNLGYLELYEYKAFLCKNGSSSDNWGFHCGDPGTAPDPYTGSFVFDNMPAGTYSVMTSFGKFYPRGKVTSSVVISDNQTTYQEMIEPVDFSAYYNKNSWESTAGNPIFQTFVATGTSISRVTFAKADSTSGSTVRITIRDGSAGGNVENWSQVGPSRDVQRGGYGGDHWVSWNAGEVQTTPGQTYAVRIQDLSGYGFNMYWCDDSYYPNGTGYRGSQSNPANHDYYVAVFSDNDNTEATMLPRSTGLDNLAGWKDAWAQSYTAGGTSLAGAALFATDGNWEWTATVTVHQGTPNGTQVGPTKTIHSVYGVSSAGVGGVCYSEGEVPTTKGQTYWIKYAVSGGWNVYRANEGDIYSGGQASFLQSGSWVNQSYDLYMSIYEYDPPSVPVGTNLLTNPGAETGNFTGWVRGGSPSGQPLIDPSTHYPNPNNHSGSHRFGISVGWSTANCYQYQTIAVKKGEAHSVSLWSTHMDGTDEHVQVSWINGSWGGQENLLYDIGPGNSGTTWLQQSGQSFTPPASLATIVLRYKHDAASNIASIHVDDISVSATGPTPTNTPTNTPTRTPTRTPTNTPTNTPTSAAQQTITIDDWFDNQGAFDSNWTAYGTSPARYIKYEYWCGAYGNLVEIQSSNGGYYRIFNQASAGASYTLTVDQVRGNGARYIRVDSNGGTNPAVYDKVWNSNGGTWNCETPSTLTGTVGASGQVTVFLGTTNNGQFRHLRMVFVQGGPEPTNTPTSTPTRTPTNTPTRTRTPTNTPTRTPTSTPTRTPTNTPTRTPTNTPTRTPTSTPTSTPGGCSGEALDSLTNLSFQTSWSYEPTPNDPSGWEVVQWVQGGPQYYTGSELSSGRPSDHRCKYEFASGGTGSDHVIVKEIEWGSATAVNVAAYCAGRKWDGSSNGTMSIGVDRNGCGTSWSDADVSTGRTSNDTTWAQISLSNVTKPSGATTFTLMLRANRSGTSWNCQFDAVSVEDASGFSQAADPAPARVGWLAADPQEPPRG